MTHCSRSLRRFAFLHLSGGCEVVLAGLHKGTSEHGPTGEVEDDVHRVSDGGEQQVHSLAQVFQTPALTRRRDEDLLGQDVQPGRGGQQGHVATGENHQHPQIVSLVPESSVDGCRNIPGGAAPGRGALDADDTGSGGHLPGLEGDGEHDIGHYEEGDGDDGVEEESGCHVFDVDPHWDVLHGCTKLGCGVRLVDVEVGGGPQETEKRDCHRHFAGGRAVLLGVLPVPHRCLDCHHSVQGQNHHVVVRPDRSRIGCPANYFAEIVLQVKTVHPYALSQRAFNSNNKP